MKNIYILLFLVFCLTVEVQATIHQVNNINPATGHFSGLQSAINAAANGDTIYIHGSHQDYGSVTLNKRLTLIGPGWAPRMQNSQTAKIDQIALNTSSDPGSGATLTPDSSELIGIVMLTYINGGGYKANNLLLKRVFFSNSSWALFSFGGNNHQFIGCWFRGKLSPSGPSMDNWQFLNCIFDPNETFITAPITNPTFIQCIFTRRNVNPILNMFGTYQGGSSNASFVNNIFMLINPTPNCSGCTYLNNMTYGAGAPDLDNFGIVSEDNFIATTLGFVNFNFGTAYYSSADLTFESGAPAIGAGLNGEDLGVMGGSPGNFVKFGQPDIPKLELMQMLNTSVKQGDDLKIRIRATAIQY